MEIGMGVILPFVLLTFEKVRRSERGLFLSSVLIILGFVLDRLNVAVTGMQAAAGATYFPSWMEISITLAIVTAGFVAFAVAARYLPLFEHEHVEEPASKAAEGELVGDLDLISRPYAVEQAMR
jgi:Ni/Fe-hydrogenase subunit HybB-like protein